MGGELDGKEGVEDEGATAAHADMSERISGGNGEVFIEGHVTSLTLEDQGERANIQNEIGDRGGGDLSPEGNCERGDADDASCAGKACQSRMEGSLTGEMECDEEISRQVAKTQRERRERRDLATASEDG